MNGYLFNHSNPKEQLSILKQLVKIGIPSYLGHPLIFNKKQINGYTRRGDYDKL